MMLNKTQMTQDPRKVPIRSIFQTYGYVFGNFRRNTISLILRVKYKLTCFPSLHDDFQVSSKDYCGTNHFI